MNILVIYPYIPFPIDRGTYQRVFHLLRALARDHTVDLLALSENGERVEHRGVFEEFCRRVTFVPFEHPAWPRLFPDRLAHPLPTTIRHWQVPALATAIREQLAQHNYDFVHVCDIVMAQYFLDEHQNVPLSVDRSRVDLQFQLEQHSRLNGGLKDALLFREQIWKLRRFERRVARRSSLQVVCGPDDETFIRAEISKDVSVQVITNGVDLDYFTPESVTAERATDPTLIFCGAMDYMPNIDALSWFFDDIHYSLLAHIPDLRVIIVGKSPTEAVRQHASRTGVTVTGGVPDVRPYYRQAWAQIVPLRVGGGTRLKIPESMAVGTPVISTTIGAQGLSLQHGEEILLADSAEDFTQQCVRMLTDAALRQHIELRGMQTCSARFGWPRLGGQLSQAYTSLFDTSNDDHANN